MGVIKIRAMSKSELECLGMGHLFRTLAFVFRRMNVPKSLKNTHEPNCNKRLTTLNDTGTSRQKGQAWKAVRKAACQRNAEMLVRVQIGRKKKKTARFPNCLWQRNEGEAAGKHPHKPKDVPSNKSNTKTMPTLPYAILQIDLGR